MLLRLVVWLACVGFLFALLATFFIISALLDLLTRVLQWIV